MSDEAGAHGDPMFHDREMKRINDPSPFDPIEDGPRDLGEDPLGPNPIDTIREATVRNGVCLVCGSGVTKSGTHIAAYPCPLGAALTEVEHELAAADGFAWHEVEHSLIERAEAAETALAETKRLWNEETAELEQLRIKNLHRAEAAEQRANDLEADRDEWIKATADNGALADDLADALRDSLRDFDRHGGCTAFVARVRAALDRHTTKLENHDRPTD